MNNLEISPLPLFFLPYSSLLTIGILSVSGEKKCFHPHTVGKGVLMAS
jgi:hypothetical protein